MKGLNALEVYELDYWAARAVGKPVRVGKSASGEHTVCWAGDSKQMYSPSTRWRQASHFLILMAKAGRVIVTGGETEKQRVVFEPRGYGDTALIDAYVATHDTSLSVALVRCFLLWHYGQEVFEDVPV